MFAHLIEFFLILLVILPRLGRAIDCFKCISINHDNRACDDTFHNNFSTDFFQSPCMGGRKNRDGLFPATACIKITGVFDDDGSALTVRSCALDSGTLTTDTEIVRMSHCGGFYYERRFVRGCVQSCDDADGCNHTWSMIQSNVFVAVLISIILSLLSTLIYGTELYMQH